MRTLQLKKNEDRRLRLGHLWIFSNEVDTAKTPLKKFEPGEPVRIISAGGHYAGSGYVNPASLIAARILSFDPEAAIGPELIAQRIEEALALREELFPDPCYRLVFGEGDYLPGLVVDRYVDVFCVQTTTAGMERFKGPIAALLAQRFLARSVVFKNDMGVRALEGLPLGVEAAVGELPESVEVRESGCTFSAPLADGQKTGWFYDMRMNRQRFAKYVQGKSVLDVFSYVGAAAVIAAKAGAERVVCVDASEKALDYAGKNAWSNEVGEKVETARGDAFEVMRELRASGRRFGAVSIDPPAFVKSKKDLEQGIAAYIAANRDAMKLLAPGGTLMTSSCSQHVSVEEFRKIVVRAARQAGTRFQIVEQGHQGPDHPVHPAMPETEYLKTLILRAVD